MALSSFHPLVREWFEGRFEAPSEVQIVGWQAIRANRHALLCAPTGSGKTLAAFLTCIDDLIRSAIAGTLEDRAQVVYVSPLKALSNDVRKNLQEPLDEIAALAAEKGIDLPPIRIATRTGDTKASERSKTAKRPPHIWVTTPESLFILLTSESGRRGLEAVRTVIVDEIHAVADSKRGSHLALSVERLEQLTGRPLLRIGLSATVSPLDEVARLLVGTSSVNAEAAPDCIIIDQGRKRTLDVALELPDDELGPIASNALWATVLDRIAELSKENRTTLVFVNTRKLVERVSHQLTMRLGDGAVAAHHGSLARATRLDAEERLKNADVKVCVATASLELGIDIGAIDLVCQIGSTRSVAVTLQRIGRSGHSVGRTPKGRLFPLTRDELVECAALLRLMRRGELDALVIPDWPLDILAQQIVAMCASESFAEDELFAICRRAWVYRELPREKFDQVIEMLSHGFDTSRGRRSAMLLRDGVNNTVKGRRGARIAALTSGGAIPDNADFDVVLEPDGLRVGRINEDFAIESNIGDVFLLGNASWQIVRVERGTVRVQDAKGKAPTIPFWLGEAPARTVELSHEIGALRDEIDHQLDSPEQAVATLMREPGLTRVAAEQLVAYIAEGKRVLGLVPTQSRIIAERFFDESGGMQLVIHAPFGARINRAWGLGLRKKFCRSFDFELQAAATDDGINLSLGPQHSFPLEDVFQFLSPQSAEAAVVQAVLPSPIFAARWRWTAGRSLALLRFQGGRRVPPPIQRMRSDDLLAAVFPRQAACQDNAPPGDIEPPDHPLVFETIRDCLCEALDVAGLVDILEKIRRDEIEIHAKDTPQPSVFAHQILNAMPYAFLDDAPLEERRARAVSLRRALPDDPTELGRLDPEAIRAATEDAWPTARDADELHDALMTLVLVRETELEEHYGGDALNWVDHLAGAGRIARFGDRVAATERGSMAALAVDGDSAALIEVLRGRSASTGPFTTNAIAAVLGLDSPGLTGAAHALESEGVLLRGPFTDKTNDGAERETEWCDRRILARIHRATIRTLRREIEPVPVAVFLAFLAKWQHLGGDGRANGSGGLVEVIEQLQGFEAAAAAWETSILPLRTQRFEADMLDRLCLSGEVVWGRFAARTRGKAPEQEGEEQKPKPGRRAPLSRVAPLSLALRRDLPWLLHTNGAPALSSRGEAVRDLLERSGASFAEEIALRCGLLPTELEEALGELIAGGIASADGFGPLRNLARGARKNGRRPGSRFGRRIGRGRTSLPQAEGRWWLLKRPDEEPAAGVPEDALEERAAQLLRRYGVLFRDLLTREPSAPPWRDLLRVLRRAEARGEIRGGRFVAGLVGEQYALPEAVTKLRKLRRQEPAGALVVISASDPMNLAGILTPGGRIPANVDNRIVLRDGVPIAWRDASGNVTVRPEADDDSLERARDALTRPDLRV